MEIEEFIEQDVLIFLDERLDKAKNSASSKFGTASTMFLTRDYEKELFAALDRQDIVQAKKVLYALKQQFEECPNGTPDKQQLKVMLMNLYEKFKDHIDAEHTFGKINSTLETTAPPAAAPEAPVVQQHATSTNDAPQKLSPEQLAQLTQLITTVETHLDNHEYKDAATAYRSLRKYAHQLGHGTPLELSMRCLTLFGRIKQEMADAKHAATQKTEMTIQPAAPIPPSSTLEQPSRKQQSPDNTVLQELEREKKTLDKMLRQNDIKGSAEQYRKMRMLAMQLQDSATRASTKEKLLRIHDIIDKMRKHPALNERKLMAVP